jgi:hypothetical protein
MQKKIRRPITLTQEDIAVVDNEDEELEILEPGTSNKKARVTQSFRENVRRTTGDFISIKKLGNLSQEPHHTVRINFHREEWE